MQPGFPHGPGPEDSVGYECCLHSACRDLGIKLWDALWTETHACESARTTQLLSTKQTLQVPPNKDHKTLLRGTLSETHKNRLSQVLQRVLLIEASKPEVPDGSFGHPQND